MYIEETQGYYTASGEQHTRRARFLILCQPPMEWKDGKPDLAGPPMRALVRKVALAQCGHWMMGTARAFGHSITISGAYGGDGLGTKVPREVYDRATPVPPELIEKWNKGGGWNSAGSEAPAMREWALETFPTNRRG